MTILYYIKKEFLEIFDIKIMEKILIIGNLSSL